MTSAGSQAVVGRKHLVQIYWDCFVYWGISEEKCAKCLIINADGVYVVLSRRLKHYSFYCIRLLQCEWYVVTSHGYPAFTRHTPRKVTVSLNLNFC